MNFFKCTLLIFLTTFFSCYIFKTKPMLDLEQGKDTTIEMSEFNGGFHISNLTEKEEEELASLRAAEQPMLKKEEKFPIWSFMGKSFAGAGLISAGSYGLAYAISQDPITVVCLGSALSIGTVVTAATCVVAWTVKQYKRAAYLVDKKNGNLK